jgi:F-type H+-transporting ATPase subunit a
MSSGTTLFEHTLGKKSFEEIVDFFETDPITGTTFEHGDAVIGASSVLGTWTICLVLLGLSILARTKLNASMAQEGTDKYLSDEGFSIKNMFEVYTTFIYDLAAGLLPKKEARGFYWLFGGMFLYILFSNLMGVLPTAVPPSQSISNNLAMSIVVLLVFVGVGVAQQGIGYITHMMGPIWWLAPLMLVIEGFGAFIVRPVSLAVRLTGNLSGDHIVLGIVSGLAPYVLPVLALCLGVFVSFVQSFVFTLLTMVYISLSLSHDDHH